MIGLGTQEVTVFSNKQRILLYSMGCMAWSNRRPFLLKHRIDNDFIKCCVWPCCGNSPLRHSFQNISELHRKLGLATQGMLDLATKGTAFRNTHIKRLFLGCMECLAWPHRGQRYIPYTFHKIF